VPFIDAADRRDDLPGRAITALERILIDEGLLHRVESATWPRPPRPDRELAKGRTARSDSDGQPRSSQRAIRDQLDLEHAVRRGAARMDRTLGLPLATMTTGAHRGRVMTIMTTDVTPAREDEEGRFTSSRSRSRDDDEDRRGHGGWFGDRAGHAEAARQPPGSVAPAR
jgi:hypothetical protein